MKKLFFYLVGFVLLWTITSCSTKSKSDETLFTTSGQAWVYESGNQKIAFTLDDAGYKNYFYDYELDIVIGLELGFHVRNDLLFFHHEWLDEQGNYLGVWGDSLFLAQHPDGIGNLYVYSISGKRLTLTKPDYGYIDPCQAIEFGDVSYVFYKQSFTPPQITYRSLEDPDELGFYVYDIQGRRIWEAFHETDSHYMFWNGTNYKGDKVPAGLYFYLLKTDEMISFQGILLLM